MIAALTSSLLVQSIVSLPAQLRTAAELVTAIAARQPALALLPAAARRMPPPRRPGGAS
ncbi:MAG: hypothetical protein ACOY9I_15190 [Pseudomonadota bacterium]